MGGRMRSDVSVLTNLLQLVLLIFDIIIVGSQFVAQAQNVWDLDPMSPIQ